MMIEAATGSYFLFYLPACLPVCMLLHVWLRELGAPVSCSSHAVICQAFEQLMM